MKKKILGLIPARAGSKGIPCKNTRLLLGKSLIERAFESALASQALDRIVLSSNDQAAIAIAERIGLEVPFIRSDELSRDTTPMVDVAIDAVNELRKTGYCADALLLLQPTSPLRKPDQIQLAVGALKHNTSVCSVFALPKTYCPHYVMRIDGNGMLCQFLPDGPFYQRRQDVPQAYVRDGTIYLVKMDTLLGQRSFYGRNCYPIILDSKDVLTLDSPDDWAMAEKRLLEAKRLGETTS